MSSFMQLHGRVLDVRRYVVPFDPRRPDSARERWELWLKLHDGSEQKFIVHSCELPVRRGHRISLALDGGEPVALFNATTQAQLNIVRANPRALFLGRDVLPPILLFFTSVIVAAVARTNAMFVVAIPLASLYIPARVVVRYLNGQADKARSDQCLAAIVPAGKPEHAPSAKGKTG